MKAFRGVLVCGDGLGSCGKEGFGKLGEGRVWEVWRREDLDRWEKGVFGWEDWRRKDLGS